ncbi:hypothetical protein HJC23_001796 [Cyclotella cryptica]|uniref:EF-hand domain-containing protein n=1 Tax=Cyclotella cryptica TaxID=29204 RepID=A0ABD3QQ70_9STRA|eukprot:CCRYP_003370-RA/>CCRYP_003370-RA protein AED:0.11 eAED:0.11 QI:116/1/1/1/0.5/0.33/3/198/623
MNAFSKASSCHGRRAASTLRIYAPPCYMASLSMRYSISSITHGQRLLSWGRPTRRCYHPSISVASDNLLGYSPMAQRSPSKPQPSGSGNDKPSASTPSTGAIWGVDSNTAGGGVWAQTSAKKDKLNELLTELNSQGVETGLLGMESLDLAANSEEKLDLAFADGLKCIAKCVDGHVDVAAINMCNESNTDTNKKEVASAMQQVSNETNEAKNQLFQMLSNVSAEEEWTRSKFEATMNEAIRILSSSLPADPSLKKPVAGSLDLTSSLCYIREFIQEKGREKTELMKEVSSFAGSDIPDNLQNEINALNQIITQAFSTSVRVYKTLILRAVAQTLHDNWDSLTTLTSGDIDRAAVSNPGSAQQQQRTTVNAKSIKKIFESYNTSPCCNWVESWWELMDADNDGLIDQEEMNTVVDLAMKPIHSALKHIVDMSLEVCPSRRVGLVKGAGNAWFLGGDDTSSLEDTKTNTNLSTSNTLTWRNRRAELNSRKIITKTFLSTLNRHFRDQVETPHRLRCIYAWAEKSHQNNKIDSILVDASEEWGAASSIVGRKRYVELEPKISYQEFRDVQVKHFPQLDKLGEEIVVSFKEDLWVLQGKRRQNAELRRDCFLFLAGVSLVDFGIGML